MGLVASEDGESYVPVFYESWDAVPTDRFGRPTDPVVNAQYQPSITIENSGTVVSLVLNFTGGLAYMRNPITAAMMPGRDMTGWTYGIQIDLGFAKFSHDLDDPNTAKIVPENVRTQLQNFTSAEFSITSLFLDFE